MIRYSFREDGPVIVKDRQKADAQRIGEALEDARRKTPEGGDMRVTVLEAARNRRHYLNRFFEWDDTVAAQKYRLSQVNLLICSIRVEDDDGNQQHAFISVTPDRGKKAFNTPSEVLDSAALQMALLQAAERDLLQWRRRYASLRDLCADADEMLDKIKRRREQSGVRTSAA